MSNNNAGDCTCDLIRREQERAAKVAKLQRLITEGIDSGVCDSSNGEIQELARMRAVAARAY